MKLLGQTLDWVAYNRCYLVSNLNAMSLLTGKEISIDLFRSFLVEMKSRWHNPKYWKIFTSWTAWTLKRRSENMGDNITVREIDFFSARFWSNIFMKRPMVVSINVWNEFRTDREDWTLTDDKLEDITTTGHAIVLQGLKFVDSRRDQKSYSFTREYLKNVSWLFKSRKALEFIKK